LVVGCRKSTQIEARFLPASSVGKPWIEGLLRMVVNVSQDENSMTVESGCAAEKLAAALFSSTFQFM
jgi:hypothetical protein